MRVVCFNDRYPAMSETFVLEHIRGIMDRGHELRVVARQRVEGPVHPLATELEHVVRPLFVRGHSLQNVPRLLRRALSDTRALRCLDPTRFGRRALSRKILSWAEPWLDVDAHDVILAQHGHEGQIAARLRRAGIATKPMVTVFHGSDISTASDPGKYRELFASGESFVANSEFTRSKLLAAGCPESRLCVIPMGIRADEFPVEPRKPLVNRPLRVLCVARLVPVKGLEFGIRAISACAHPVELIIVGDGPCRKDLALLADDLGVSHQVVFRGSLTRPGVIEEIQKSDLLMCPGVTLPNGEAEALGVAPMEAMACGRAVIATQTGGLPEVIEGGVTGLLLPERDPSAIAEALDGLSTDPDKLDRFGVAGRKRVARVFDAGTLNNRLVDLLEQIAG
ncbi:MAG: glycosyltransferase [Planctomycetota bacterium]